MALPKAVGVVVDSNAGKTNAVRRYGLDESRVHVVPFEPPLQVRVKEGSHQKFDSLRKQNGFRDPYLYYPAQLWPHKNHVLILEALSILNERGEDSPDLVMTGGDEGNLDHVLACANELGVRDQVHYLGYVEADLIPHFYTNALALCMPTYFGPTNIPPLEASALGAKSIISRLSGADEQPLRNTVFVGVDDAKELAQTISGLMAAKDGEATSCLERAEPAVPGDNRDSVEQINAILSGFERIRSRWR